VAFSWGKRHLTAFASAYINCENAIGAMALGILAAFGVLRACFALVRPKRRHAAVKPQPEVARIS
jgi:hypothetical protein